MSVLRLLCCCFLFGAGPLLLVSSCASSRPEPYVYVPMPGSEGGETQRPEAPAPKIEEPAPSPSVTPAVEETTERPRWMRPRPAPPPAETVVDEAVKPAPAPAPAPKEIPTEPAPPPPTPIPEPPPLDMAPPPVAELPTLNPNASMAAAEPFYRLRAGDPVVVHLRGVPDAANYEYIIDDAGQINLPYIPSVTATGLTASELQRTIADSYIHERIYRQITVNVILPTQSYFVHGEVRQPGRYPLTSGLTVLKAIAAAGGYTEFANRRRVEINRAGETINVNARTLEERPDRDIEIKVNDVITVRRSVF